MRRLYAARRACLLQGIEEAFGVEGVEVMGEAAGLHLALRFGGARFSGLCFDEAVTARIASAGAIVYPALRYAFAPLPDVERIVLLGYGNLSELEIKLGLAAFASALVSPSV
jgi:DNA-binding transcriptional MocR family regulator